MSDDRQNPIRREDFWASGPLDGIVLDPTRPQNTQTAERIPSPGIAYGVEVIAASRATTTILIFHLLDRINAALEEVSRAFETSMPRDAAVGMLLRANEYLRMIEENFEHQRRAGSRTCEPDENLEGASRATRHTEAALRKANRMAGTGQKRREAQEAVVRYANAYNTILTEKALQSLTARRDAEALAGLAPARRQAYSQCIEATSESAYMPYEHPHDPRYTVNPPGDVEGTHLIRTERDARESCLLIRRAIAQERKALNQECRAEISPMISEHPVIAQQLAQTEVTAAEPVIGCITRELPYIVSHRDGRKVIKAIEEPYAAGDNPLIARSEMKYAAAEAGRIAARTCSRDERERMLHAADLAEAMMTATEIGVHNTATDKWRRWAAASEQIGVDRDAMTAVLHSAANQHERLAEQLCRWAGLAQTDENGPPKAGTQFGPKHDQRPQITKPAKISRQLHRRWADQTRGMEMPDALVEAIEESAPKARDRDED